MNLPIAIQGRIADCIQLTYRTPADSVRGLLPAGLELVQRGPWAFWSVVISRVEKARPMGLPALCGVSYCQVAYRLKVQAMNDRAEVVSGLYFVRSDVDGRAVSVLGNKLADFKMHSAAVSLETDDCGVCCRVQGTAGGEGDVLIEAAHAPARLSAGSCFPTVEDARRFCAFAPNGLSVVQVGEQRRLRITRVVREQSPWSQTPVVLHEARLGFFDAMGQTELAALEWASRHSGERIRVQVGETALLLQQLRVVNEAVLATG